MHVHHPASHSGKARITWLIILVLLAGALGAFVWFGSRRPGPLGGILRKAGIQTAPGQLLYTAMPNKDSAPHLTIVNADGSGEARFAVKNAAMPRVSPDGAHVVYIANPDKESFFGNLTVAKLDGSMAKQMNTEALRPVYSPDGKAIAFVSNRKNEYGVYLMCADGSWTTQLARDGADNPAFSPNSKKVAYAASGIWVVDTVGTGRAQLTKTDTWDGNPAFTSDSRIIYESEHGGKMDLFSINVDGSGKTQLTHTAAWNDDFDISPDGKQLVYVEDNQPEDQGGEVAFTHGDICLMNIDGSHRQPLTSTHANNRGPRFSPDGRWIAFNADQHGKDGIFVMRTDGSGVQRVTTGLQPIWLKGR